MLTKFVVVDEAGTWYQMYQTERLARLAIRTSDDALRLHVEKWTYRELPDGTHDSPGKQRLPDPAREATDEGVDEMTRGVPYSEPGQAQAMSVA